MLHEPSKIITTVFRLPTQSEPLIKTIILAISVNDVFKSSHAFCQILNGLCYQEKNKSYPGAQTQPLIQGEDGAQVKFMARFAHVVSQFTPPAGNSG